MQNPSGLYRPTCNIWLLDSSEISNSDKCDIHVQCKKGKTINDAF